MAMLLNPKQKKGLDGLDRLERLDRLGLLDSNGLL